jgi:hypothetical protein
VDVEYFAFSIMRRPERRNMPIIVTVPKFRASVYGGAASDGADAGANENSRGDAGVRTQTEQQDAKHT